MLSGFGCKVVGPGGRCRQGAGAGGCPPASMGALVDVNPRRRAARLSASPIAPRLAARHSLCLRQRLWPVDPHEPRHLDAPVLAKPFDEQMLREAVQNLNPGGGRASAGLPPPEAKQSSASRRSSADSTPAVGHCDFAGGFLSPTSDEEAKDRGFAGDRARPARWNRCRVLVTTQPCRHSRRRWPPR